MLVMNFWKNLQHSFPKRGSKAVWNVFRKFFHFGERRLPWLQWPLFCWLLLVVLVVLCRVGHKVVTIIDALSFSKLLSLHCHCPLSFNAHTFIDFHCSVLLKCATKWFSLKVYSALFAVFSLTLSVHQGPLSSFCLVNWDIPVSTDYVGGIRRYSSRGNSPNQKICPILSIGKIMSTVR